MDSIFLQKQVCDNAKALQEYYKDIQEWGDEMRKKEESLKRSSNNQTENPQPKNKVSKTEPDKNSIPKKKIKKIKGCDYAAWEKFDADEYIKKMDKEEAAEDSSPESDLSDEIDETSIDLANSEKEKGNNFVKKQQWNRAIECYTRAIECYAYDPIYYANRALCYLKKEKYQNAESDCTTALQLDKTYVKAYQRRAAARENLNQLSEAHSDVLRVIELEPKNKESKTVLVRLEKKLENIKQEKNNTTEEQRPISKFTLSRQRNKQTATDLQTKTSTTKKDVPAFGEHIIEHVAPATSSSVIKECPKINSTETKEHNVGDNKLQSIKDSSSELELTENLLFNKHNMKDIQLFKSIHKPPRSRSKKPLKRIEIIDVDLETEKKYLADKSKNDDDKEEQLPQNEKEDDQCKDENTSNIRISEAIRNETNMATTLDVKDSLETFSQLNLTIPKTAVQFYNSWSTIAKNNQWKKSYLQQINPNELPVIFKESLGSKVFSEIIDALNENCNDNSFPIYEYLIGLSQVKRFSALTMFMSSKDKNNLLNIIHHLKQDNRNAEIDIENLIKLYEL